MRNKIINGIDVSECSYYNKDNEPYCCEIWDNECEAQNCYFKQFKRLQKENEELGKIIDCKTGTIQSLVKARDDLKQENEELKANKGRCAFKCLDNTFCDEAKIQIDQLELDKDCLNASLETARKYRGIAEVDRDKYKLALEEIREITEVNSLNTCWTILYNCNDCHNNNECGEQSPIAKLKFIKDKIDEVCKDFKIGKNKRTDC